MVRQACWRSGRQQDGRFLLLASIIDPLEDWKEATHTQYWSIITPSRGTEKVEWKYKIKRRRHLTWEISICISNSIHGNWFGRDNGASSAPEVGLTSRPKWLMFSSLFLISIFVWSEWDLRQEAVLFSYVRTVRLGYFLASRNTDNVASYLERNNNNDNTHTQKNTSSVSQQPPSLHVSHLAAPGPSTVYFRPS